MSSSRRPVQATIKIINDDPEKFELVSAVNKGSDQDPELVFNNNQGGEYKPGFRINFTIEDQTGKGYVFFQDPRNPSLDDAMAAKIVNKNGTCPRAGQTWDGFAPISLSQDKKTLTVDNPNDYKQYFGFGFFFARPGVNKAELVYDPAGNNQNGEPPQLQ